MLASTDIHSDGRGSGGAARSDLRGLRASVWRPSLRDTPRTHIAVLAITLSLHEERLGFELTLGTRRIRQLSIERLAIAKTPAQKLRPFRNGGKRVGLLRQQAPEFRVMPTQLLAGTVAMLSYAGTQTFDLGDERLSIEMQKVFVHGFQRLQESARLMSLSSQPSCSLTNAERRR